MVRNLTIAALLCAAAAVPAVAQDRDEGRYDSAERMAETMRGPARIDAMGDMVEAMTRALLAMPVGPLADAASRIDPDSDLADVPPDATLGELAGADDEDMSARIGDETRDAGRAMASMTGEMARMLPVFEAMAHDMAAQMQDNMDRARRARR